MSCDDLGPFPFTKKYLLTSILDKFDDLEVRMDQQRAEWTRLFELLEIKGDRHMAEVTGQMQTVLDTIKAEADALATRVETKIVQITEAMDATEAAPLIAFGGEIATGLRSILASATGGGGTTGGTVVGGSTGETAVDATEV